ncbi:hypothetical protein ACO0QE_001933 [Hanseniaspora vineae]
MPKENLIFKLDNLEYQYHHLNNSLESFDPRLNTTRKFFTMKGKNNIKNLDKKLNSTTVAEVEAKLNKLKHQIVTNKIHHLEKKLFLNLEKYYTANSAKSESESSKSALPLSTYKHITKSKIIKLCMNKLLNSKSLKQDPPTWVKELDIYVPFSDAQNLENPSYVYKTYLSNNKEANKFFSKFAGDKKQIKLFKEFENGMDVFLNINKGKHDDQQEEQVVQPKNNSNKAMSSEKYESSGDESDEEGQEGEVDEDALVAQYEGLVALSEDEDSGDERGLRDDVDYNEVTDLEPTEEEEEDASDDIELGESSDEEEQPLKKKQKKSSAESSNDVDAQKKQKQKQEEKEKKQKKKIALPALEYGFLDQGEFGNGHDSNDNASDLDDPFFDRPEPKKQKNRKGQRQRRLIWEKKYGKSANHVQKEIAKKREEREKRQKEFEEREEKRQQRVKEQFENDRAKYLKKKDYESKEFHPSWEAKKVQEEKLKNVKFSGKKVVFD